MSNIDKIKRVFLIVLDSYGIGELPDAANYGDVGSNTLGSIVKSDKYNTPNLKKMGLFNIDGVDLGNKVEAPVASFARLMEASRGKDGVRRIEREKRRPRWSDGGRKRRSRQKKRKERRRMEGGRETEIGRASCRERVSSPV